MSAFDAYQQRGLQKDATEKPAPTFYEELASLLNKYSKENESGTPDFILADYLAGCLDTFNKTIRARAQWRGESVELPALQKHPSKRVPIVQYADGRRNEIGTAKIEISPGEGLFAGDLDNIESVVPVVGNGVHFDTGEGQFTVDLGGASDKGRH